MKAYSFLLFFMHVLSLNLSALAIVSPFDYPPELKAKSKLEESMAMAAFKILFESLKAELKTDEYDHEKSSRRC